MKRFLPKKEAERTYLLTEYGRQKLSAYANSFKTIARLAMEEEMEDKVGDELEEKREVFAGNLNEMAAIMSKLAGQVFAFRPFPVSKKRRILQFMKSEGIIVTDLYYVEEDELLRVVVSMKADKNRKREMKEVADMFSVNLNERLVPSLNSPGYVDEFLRTYLLVKEPRFGVLTGISKAIKENETVSGDNFSVSETENGILNVLLSDGVGSGSNACADSEAVLELMEQLVETGYTSAQAAKLINNSFLTLREEKNMSTLDICSINLYTGVCEFIKYGAAATYIKHGHTVEKLYESTFPLGAFCRKEQGMESRKLMDSDYVIMVSDGVLDAFDEEEYGSGFLELIRQVEKENPKQIAEELLQLVLYKTGGVIMDDMTILVLGIWEDRQY